MMICFVLFSKTTIERTPSVCSVFIQNTIVFSLFFIYNLVCFLVSGQGEGDHFGGAGGF